MHRGRFPCMGLFVGVLLAILTFTACEKSSDERIELRFSFYGTFPELTTWTKVKRGFEALHPNVRVKLEYIPTDYRTKLRLQLVAGTAPDVFVMDDDVQAGFAIRGHMENLDPWIARDREELRMEEFLPTSLEAFQFDGHQYALPWAGFSVLVFCNLDLFDAEGIPYPDTSWTWEDFRRIAIRLTKDYDGDGRIDQFGTNAPLYFLGAEPLIWAWGGRVLNEDGTRCMLDSPEAIAAVKFIRDLIFVDNASPKAGQMPGIQWEIAILTGRLGMVISPAFIMPNLRATKGMRWDVFHMPKGPARRASRTSWDGIALNARSDKKDLGWEFIKYVVSEDAQKHIARLSRGMPTKREYVLKYFVRPETPQHEERFLEATEYSLLTPSLLKYETFELEALRWFDRIRLGTVDVETAMREIARTLNELLEEGRREREKFAAMRAGGERMP